MLRTRVDFALQETYSLTVTAEFKRRQSHYAYGPHVNLQRTTATSPQIQVRILSEDSQKWTPRFRILGTLSNQPDSMKGDRFPSSVRVELNGREFRGCGRDLAYPWR